MKTNNQLDVNNSTAFVSANHSKSSVHGRLIERGRNVAVHADICGSMTPQIINGRKSLLTKTTAEQ